MTWQYIWSFIVQPVLFIALVVMTIMSTRLAIHAFNKQLKKDEELIHHNEENIQDLYKQLAMHVVNEGKKKK